MDGLGNCSVMTFQFNYSKSECENLCSREILARTRQMEPKHQCDLPMDAGPCEDLVTMWYFDGQMAQCRRWAEAESGKWKAIPFPSSEDSLLAVVAAIPIVLCRAKTANCSVFIILIALALCRRHPHNCPLFLPLATTSPSQSPFSSGRQRIEIVRAFSPFPSALFWPEPALCG